MAPKPESKTSPKQPSGNKTPASAGRITSIDALRGLVMFTMIFVNDLSGVPKTIVPQWMRHYPGNANGMTFVDLVFPGFLFIIGMSIPSALGAREARGESIWKTLLHVAARTLSLMLIGILMVNETPDSKLTGFSGDLWCALMYGASILAFWAAPQPKQGEKGKSPAWNAIARIAGFVTLIWLAFVFRGAHGEKIISLAPFHLNTQWYGILGLLGWAYLTGALVWLIFKNNRTALLGCAALLMCLYPAERLGAFEHFWLARFVGIGGTLGSQSAITVMGMILGSILLTPETAGIGTRARFTLLFAAGCAAAALLLHRLYGINKNSATPSWCFWACATTAVLWLICHFIFDASRNKSLAALGTAAGGNVLLPYLLSEMLPSTLSVLHLGSAYDSFGAAGLAQGVLRSILCATLIMTAGIWLTKKGLRLKL